MASLREIARVAGVSASTVSRAMNRPDDVSVDTRDRVLSAARSLGWHPEAPTRPREGIGAITVVVPDLEMPPFAAILKSVQQRAHQAGLQVLFADSNRERDLEQKLIAELGAVTVGAVVCSPRSDPAFLRERAQIAPLVVVDARIDGVASVAVDYASGMSQIVDNLQALGHTRVAYAGARSDTWSERERRAALHAALADRGLDDFIDLGGFGAGIAAGYAAADQLVASKSTAVVCINNFLALGMMKRLERRGIRVPSDVSIVSFDNVNSSQLVSPLLSSVVPPPNAVGWAAADMLVRLVGDSATEPVHRLIPVDLLSMETTDFRSD